MCPYPYLPFPSAQHRAGADAQSRGRPPTPSRSRKRTAARRRRLAQLPTRRRLPMPSRAAVQAQPPPAVSPARPRSAARAVRPSPKPHLQATALSGVPHHASSGVLVRERERRPRGEWDRGSESGRRSAWGGRKGRGGFHDGFRWASMKMRRGNSSLIDSFYLFINGMHWI